MKAPPPVTAGELLLSDISALAGRPVGVIVDHIVNIHNGVINHILYLLENHSILLIYAAVPGSITEKKFRCF